MASTLSLPARLIRTLWMHHTWMPWLSFSTGVSNSIPVLQLLDAPLFRHTWVKWKACYQAFAKCDGWRGNPSIWFSCVGAGMHLKAAGLCRLPDYYFKWCFSLYWSRSLKVLLTFILYSLKLVHLAYVLMYFCWKHTWGRY